MKMIIAIVDDNLYPQVSQALIKSNFRVTRLATTSGFLRGGETSMFVGVDNHQVDNALQIIRGQIPASPDTNKKQATIYVLNVKSFNHLL